MKKIITLGLGVILMSLTGCITSVDGYQRPKPKKADIRAKSYLDLGVAYIQKGRYDLAEPRLRYSIEIQPSADAYNALAVLYEEKHENALAEETYNTLLAQFPNYALGYMNYYVFLCKYDRQSQIETVAAKMQSNKLLAALGQVAAGDCAVKKGQTGQAEQYYKRALQYEPYSAGALLPLAKINYERGFIEEAKKQVDLVNNQVGYSAKSLYLSFLINRELGHNMEARNYLNELRTRFSDSEEAKELSGE